MVCKRKCQDRIESRLWPGYLLLSILIQVYIEWRQEKTYGLVRKKLEFKVVNIVQKKKKQLYFLERLIPLKKILCL